MTSIYFLRWLMTLLPLAPNSTFPIISRATQENIRLATWKLECRMAFELKEIAGSTTRFSKGVG